MKTPDVSPGRVCIVDDEAGVRDLLQMVCESADHPVAAYGSAEAFLGACAPGLSCCDLVLLDIDMPGMNGLELLKALRAQGCEAPVVMISGNAEPSKVGEARALGAIDFFHKPFDIRMLRQRIGELIGRVH